ncbi:hypothetical protein HDU83_005271 [Entophlyctis luteolus]|nr:hypothetical protein HDU83_005271 [Entophlyctis luteolus]
MRDPFPPLKGIQSAPMIPVARLITACRAGVGATANVVAATATKSHSNLKNISAVHGYTFRDRELLNDALLHPSVPGVSRHAFQRLELLGDAVLKLVATEILLANHPHEDERTIAKRIDRLVNAETAESMAKHVRLHEILVTGPRTRLDNSSIYADAFEALLGAVYTDAGFSLDVPRKWIESMMHLETFERDFDPKGRLQRLSGVPPKYEKVSESGSSNDKLFVVRVQFRGRTGYGVGKRKRIAEANAAAEILNILDIENDGASMEEPNRLAATVPEDAEFIANGSNFSTEIPTNCPSPELTESPFSGALAEAQRAAAIPLHYEIVGKYVNPDATVMLLVRVQAHGQTGIGFGHTRDEAEANAAKSLLGALRRASGCG